MNDVAVSNLDVVKLSGFDCIMSTRFYSTFMIFLVVPLLGVFIVLLLLVFGGSVFRKHLKKHGRKCCVCWRPLPPQLPAVGVGNTIFLAFGFR
jgi:hypothetical protein